MNHWRTTTIGVLLIVGALAKAGAELAQGQHVDLPTLCAALTAGYGFIKAADAVNVSAK